MSKTWSRKQKHERWDHPEKGYTRMMSQQEWRMCGVKTGTWSHQKEAMRASEKMEARDGIEKTWRAYECRFCGKWHLTTKPDKNPKS